MEAYSTCPKKEIKELNAIVSLNPQNKESEQQKTFGHL